MFFLRAKKKGEENAKDKISKTNVCTYYCNYNSAMLCFFCSSYEAGGFNIDVIKNSLIFIPIEFILAYLCEIFIGSPLSVKFALKAINPEKNDHMIVETAIICATVGIMCPLMSFLATILYNGIITVGIMGGSFNNFVINFIPYWLQKVVLNFPFALLSQLFFIQPLTRTIFRAIFESNEKKSAETENLAEKQVA